MRAEINRYRQHDPRIIYRGASVSRLDNLTDAVFGIAITLLIFNLANPNSFADLVTFTKTLPAFLISISFVLLIWNEHLRFSEIYTLDDTKLMVLNTLFIALVIFYVYPLRFLMLFLTNFFFQTNLTLSIQGSEVPYLMIYYSFVAFALYLTLFLFYHTACTLKGKLGLTPFETFHTKKQRTRLVIMFGVPVVSMLATIIVNQFSYVWASVAGGVVYFLYSPAILIWYKSYQKGSGKFNS